MRRDVANILLSLMLTGLCLDLTGCANRPQNKPVPAPAPSPVTQPTTFPESYHRKGSDEKVEISDPKIIVQ